MSQATALVPAAGFGTRFHEGGPKALVLLAGRPLLLHALERLAASKRVASAVIAIPRRLRGGVPRGARRRRRSRTSSSRAASRGASPSRARSRPRTRRTTTRSSSSTTRRGPSSTRSRSRPSWTPPTRRAPRSRRSRSSRRSSASRRGKIVDDGAARRPRRRDDARRPSAPAILRKGLAKEGGPDATDDAELVERTGGEVTVVLTSRWNIKITYPEDLAWAEAWLAGGGAGREPCGSATGFDAHPLVAGRPCVLGGVAVPSDVGPRRALRRRRRPPRARGRPPRRRRRGRPRLGLRDRPPGVDRTRPGRRFVRHVRELTDHPEILNVDVTILAAKPRVAEFREAMRANIAALLGVPVARVSVKASSGNGLTDFGRGRGRRRDRRPPRRADAAEWRRDRLGLPPGPRGAREARRARSRRCSCSAAARTRAPRRSRTLARGAGVPVRLVAKEELDRFAGRAHNGVAARVAEREYDDVEDCLAGEKGGRVRPLPRRGDGPRQPRLRPPDRRRRRGLGRPDRSGTRRA